MFDALHSNRVVSHQKINIFVFGTIGVECVRVDDANDADHLCAHARAQCTHSVDVLSFTCDHVDTIGWLNRRIVGRCVVGRVNMQDNKCVRVWSVCVIARACALAPTLGGLLVMRVDASAPLLVGSMGAAACFVYLYLLRDPIAQRDAKVESKKDL
jgi:hypothetical protein